MNTSVTSITNATNGAIITITKIHRPPAYHWQAALAALALFLICYGLYLLLRKEKPPAR